MLLVNATLSGNTGLRNPESLIQPTGNPRQALSGWSTPLGQGYVIYRIAQKNAKHSWPIRSTVKSPAPMPRYPERLENIMTVHIHEVDRDPTTGQAISVALCGHDDEPDSDIPAGMARRVFVGFVDGHTAAVMVSQIKAFATSVGTWLGVTDVYLYVPPIRVEENAQNMEARPLVWAYTAPIS